MAMVKENSESRKYARLAIFELSNMISVPMSLHAIVRLNVADAIWQAGSNSPVSASGILTRLKLPTADAENLQRILRMLTSYEVFTEHITDDGERKYALTEVGQTLVTDEDGLSYGPFVLQHHQDALMSVWPRVHEAVLDSSVEPFVNVNGQSAYTYYGTHEMNELMLKAMSGVSVPIMKALLEGYDGFKGVNRLVDVGGSGGDCMRMIMNKFPHITEGINFDLPAVVAKASPIPGVTHVGGDMFKEIPHADAIFMKWVLTTWTDDECRAIVKNCYDALPKGGKFITCEPALPQDSDTSHRTRALLEGDIFVMTIYRAKGKHRTEEEFRLLGLSAGFHQFKAFHFDHFSTVLEFIK